MRRRGRVVIGVDFTSAPRARKPLTVAVGRLVETAGGAAYCLDAIRELGTLAAFDDLLREPGDWLGGFDLPFGQPRTLIEHEGWPTDWPEFVRFYCGQPREKLRDVFRRWCGDRPAGDKFAWRQADRPAGSSPAMRWTNPPVAWMMHAGIGRMLAAGLAFPAHRVAGRGPARRRIASCRSESSCPANSSASAEHIQTSARAGHSSGTWSDQSSLATGPIPEALIARCMSVATVPGDRPIARMPLPAYSRCRLSVSIATPAFEAQ